MQLSDNHQVFLSLVCQGIGHMTVPLQKQVDWTVIKTMADAHGLSAVVLDGLEEEKRRTHDRINNEFFPSQSFLLQWIGETIQSYEQRYAQYEKAISGLAAFYNHHGYKMMVLKGYGLSLNYPKPSHRPCGDIDIWLFGEQKGADTILNKEVGVKIDNGHHHHTIFEWEGFTVENHYDFMNVFYGHRNRELEMIFKKLGEDDSNKIQINGQIVYLPSPNLHALFLLRHGLQDFAAAVLTMRQVLDWGLFVEKNTTKIDWEWLNGIVKEFKMIDFFNSLNSICVEDLGFSSDIFQAVQFYPFLKEKVLEDILNPKYQRQSPRGLVKGMIYKYRRWQGNAWKQELCYHDNRWAAFWNGVWNHLLKPKTI